MGERSRFQNVSDIPALPQGQDKIDPSLRQPMEQMRSAVQALIGTRGDPDNQAITFAMARKLGFLDGSNRFSVGVGNIIVPPGGNPFGPEPDLTPPPTVTNLAAFAGFSEVIVTWDAATYLQGHGNLQTNLYAVKKAPSDATLPTFDQAQLVYAATGELSIAALPSELNTRWHLWAKYQSVDGVESIAPAGGINGMTVTTGQDITQLLNVLTGQLTESQLYSSLGARIALIDGTGDGSVNARIAVESTARSGGDALAYAQYSVKLDVNGYVSGFGQANTGATSSFIVRADSFAIASPSGPGIAPTVPFVVRTTPTTENGVTVPVGVYMDAAFIVNVSALYARFGTLVADSVSTAQLNAAHLTLGDGSVGGNLKSAGYVPSTQGWIERSDGYAEFNNVEVRGGVFADYGYFTGTITAGSGAIGGAVIGATYVQSTSYVAGAGSGWRLDNTFGKLFAASVTIKKGTRVFDTDALGSSPVLQVDNAISILANGTATFSGDLTAGRISVGTASSATRFFDPANPSISLMSNAFGVFVVSSYLYTGAAITTGDDLKFKNNDSTWPIQRRLRTGSVYFSVIATATIDDQLSIWYRANGGTWTFMASVTEPQAGDGSDAVAFGISITVTANMTVEFGAAPVNSSYTANDMGKLYFRTLQVVVNGGNF